MNRRKTRQVILASSTAPQSVVFDTSNRECFSLELVYGAGSGTSAKLQASNDGTNYVDVQDSSVTLDNGGSIALWNVSNWGSQSCKLVITGDAVTCVATLSS